MMCVRRPAVIPPEQAAPVEAKVFELENLAAGEHLHASPRGRARHSRSCVGFVDRRDFAPFSKI